MGQVAVTQAALPLLRQAQGRIVFVGSIGGKVAVQFAGPYHASKYAIEAIGDCLRQELAPDGIAVAVVEPGSVSTGSRDKSARRIDDLLTRTPEMDRY
jgi:NAD(P)-dependent dehydrogenase (short-subunit alcohol dehydrogenase family)